jgi:hypothetical protein
MLFWFDKHRSKSLVPHQQFTEQNNNLKQVSPQFCRIYVPISMQLGAIILLTSARAITTDSHLGHWHINFFVVLVKAKDFHRNNLRQSHGRKRSEAFRFGEYRSKKLVPYHQPRESTVSP